MNRYNNRRHYPKVGKTSPINFEISLFSKVAKAKYPRVYFYQRTSEDYNLDRRGDAPGYARSRQVILGECDQGVVLLLHSRVDDVGHGADEEEESDCEDLEEGRDAHEVESVAE